MVAPQAHEGKTGGRNASPLTRTHKPGMRSDEALALSLGEAPQRRRRALAKKSGNSTLTYGPGVR